MKDSDNKFREIFEKSPIGILFYDKEGELTDANPAALEIAGIPSLNVCREVNLFSDPNIASRKEELIKKGLIKFQAPLNFDNVKKLYFYTSTKSGIAFIDYTVSVTDSGYLVQIQDITDRKNDEEQLKYQANLLENVNDAIFSIDLNHRIKSWNLAAEKMYGWKEEEVLGKIPWEVINNEFTEKERTKALKSLQKGTTYSNEFITYTKNGSAIWIEYTNKPVKDDNNNIIGYISISRDITQRKKSEEALKESEERYHSIFNNNHAIMLLIDPETGDIVDANPAAVSFYGYSREELKRMKITDINFISEEHVFEEMQKAQSEKKNHFLFRHRLASGEIRYVDVYSGPITVGGKNLLYSIIHDVTKQKKVEEALYKSEEKFRSLYSSMTEGVAIHEVLYNSSHEAVDYIITDVNPAYEEITSLKRSKVIEKKASELYGTGKPPYINIYSRVVESGEPVHFEAYFEPMDKYFSIAVTSPNKGKFATFFEDITERKKMEEQLKEARDNLEEQVEARTVEIEEAYQIVKENEFKLKETIIELKRSNAELQSFAYITSHDLQEPLRTIASFTQLMQRRYENKLDSDADEFMDYIVSASIRMKQMIQGLLDYSRIDSAGTEFIKTDMNDNVEKTVSNLQNAINESNAEITHDNLPNVIADPDQMVRVFQNLISNAIKYKKPDEPPRIHISTRTDKERNEWVFSVTDNGIGMEKQYTNKIFEVFKRLHTIADYEGTGIGLAVVKRIIDRHGGRVWVESEFGKGSTFYFTISINVQYEQTKFQ